MRHHGILKEEDLKEHGTATTGHSTPNIARFLRLQLRAKAIIKTHTEDGKPYIIQDIGRLEQTASRFTPAPTKILYSYRKRFLGSINGI